MDLNACRYAVYWQETKIEWTSRWFLYQFMVNKDVHWFSIVNSLVIVMLIGVILARVLLRTVQRDLVKCIKDKGKSQVRTPSYDILKNPSSFQRNLKRPSACQHAKQKVWEC
jgi:hypothetical protein